MIQWIATAHNYPQCIDTWVQAKAPLPSVACRLWINCEGITLTQCGVLNGIFGVGSPAGPDALAVDIGNLR